MSSEMVIRIQNESQNGQNEGFVSNEPFEKRPVTIIQDSDLCYDDHFGSRLVGNGALPPPAKHAATHAATQQILQHTLPHIFYLNQKIAANTSCTVKGMQQTPKYSATHTATHHILQHTLPHIVHHVPR